MQGKKTFKCIAQTFKKIFFPKHFILHYEKWIHLISYCFNPEHTSPIFSLEATKEVAFDLGEWDTLYRKLSSNFA